MTTSGGSGENAFAPIDTVAISSALLHVASLAWNSSPRRERETEEAGTYFGAFSGLPPRIELLPDGRRARLLAPLSFVQASGEEWSVPAGAELDGASIPRLAWSLIGGPFEGRYRDASIVHDHYCVVRTRSWRATHRMFYEAMRCSGEAAAKAKIMYYAVYRFGPRWSDGEETFAVEPQGATGSEAVHQAQSFAADAEAIYVHDLKLSEIESLADARIESALATTREAAVAGSETGQVSLDRVRLLVITGGSGTVEDLDAVIQEAALLPDYVVAKFERKRIRLVACRESVTDFEEDLRGVTPRGWPAGSTWDSVPGAYFQDKARVVIATIEDGGRRMVPARATGRHGSASLTVHESMHGFDYADNHAVLSNARFLAARNADMDRLDAYERQAGRAGLEETFAESGARFVVMPDAMSASWTNLFGFWQNPPFGGMEVVPEPFPELADVGEVSIGTARIKDAGTIELDLRAEGEGGAIGHAMLRISRGDAGYSDIRNHAFGDGEAMALDPVPFKPMRTTRSQ